MAKFPHTMLREINEQPQKHGPNALVSKDSPLIIIATAHPGDPDSLLRHSKVLQLMKDMRRRERIS